MRSKSWRSDFPINWQDDDYVTRRQFISFLTLISGGLFLGTLLVGAREWWRRAFARRPPELRIAAIEELPVGGAKHFTFPTPDDRCLLLRLSPDRFVAYNQSCTHLACPVIYKPGAPMLHCPCHEGYFAVEDGRPLSGPPQRPLQRIALKARDGAVWATEVKNG